WAPSWQNADAALAAEPAPVCLGVRDGDAVQGYAVLLPESGSIAQIGVAPGFRRQGVGARLVLGCRAELAGGALRLINAEAGDAGFAAFVTAMGGEPTVAQLELLKPL
ncbi:MAG: GNAT family N-acetyltransferase, partial [Pseudomonadota bacterium]